MAKNALSLYITACRSILQASTDENAWREIRRLLPLLRRSLSCAACDQLLTGPRTSSACSHSICTDCAKSKTHVTLCKDCDDFRENQQTVILLQCYRKLCEYLLYHRRYFNIGANPDLNELVQEGAAFRSEYLYAGDRDNSINSDSEGELTGSRVAANGNASSSHDSVISGDEDLCKDHGVPGGSRYKVKRHGCRCGMATPTPGKLTCCGQRCPCYVNNKDCFTCRCRGCRNPHRVNSDDPRAAEESDSSLQSSDCDI